MSQEILITDGPLACLWKALHEKGWVEMREVMKVAGKGNYSDAALRAKLYAFVDVLWDRKEESQPHTKRTKIMYRLRENTPIPENETKRTTRKDREKMREHKPAAQWSNTESKLPRWLL